MPNYISGQFCTMRPFIFSSGSAYAAGGTNGLAWSEFTLTLSNLNETSHE